MTSHTLFYSLWIGDARDGGWRGETASWGDKGNLCDELLTEEMSTIVSLPMEILGLGDRHGGGGDIGSDA